MPSSTADHGTAQPASNLDPAHPATNMPDSDASSSSQHTLQNTIMVVFRGAQHTIPLPVGSTTSSFIHAVAAATGTDPATVKLLRKGLPPITAATPRLPHLQPNDRLLLMASTVQAIRAVQNATDLPGMAGFDHEARVHAQRTVYVSGAVQLPRTRYTFCRFSTWSEPGLPLHPPEAEALQILHRLAADRGIRSVMERNKWSVGLLAEMPPEGKVGISPVCVLGYNVNAGQEIHLRWDQWCCVLTIITRLLQAAHGRLEGLSKLSAHTRDAGA